MHTIRTMSAYAGADGKRSTWSVWVWKRALSEAELKVIAKVRAHLKARK